MFNIYSQVSVCDSSKETIIDLNDIAINKCEITNSSKNIRKIIKTKNPRKRVSNRSRKKENNQSLSNSKEVLFTLVEEIPMFESCKDTNREDNVKCFKSRINKHFSKNFNTDKFINEIIKDKIFIQFSINIYGKVINSKIKSKNNNKLLHKELNRVLYKLPTFNVGKEKGLPVIVTYSFPLNMTLN